jgi:hypothetical protein
MSSSDFYYFYICGKQFKLGQSLSTVINSGFTTSNNKNKVVAPGESQPAMIFNKSISQTAICGLTVKNTSNSSKNLQNVLSLKRIRTTLTIVILGQSILTVRFPKII